MKKIIFVLFLFLAACAQNANEQNNCLYNEGDIVYLKPDSTKAVINNTRNCGSEVPNYYVDYADKYGKRHTSLVYQYEIFGR